MKYDMLSVMAAKHSVPAFGAAKIEDRLGVEAMIETNGQSVGKYRRLSMAEAVKISDALRNNREAYSRECTTRDMLAARVSIDAQSSFPLTKSHIETALSAIGMKWADVVPHAVQKNPAVRAADARIDARLARIEDMLAAVLESLGVTVGEKG